MTHRRAWIGLAGGDLNVTQADPGVELAGGGEQRLKLQVREPKGR